MYLITSESKVSNYIVALEDDFGFVPLWSANNFDMALRLMELAEEKNIQFTTETEELFDAF